MHSLTSHSRWGGYSRCVHVLRDMYTHKYDCTSITILKNRIKLMVRIITQCS